MWSILSTGEPDLWWFGIRRKTDRPVIRWACRIRTVQNTSRFFWVQVWIEDKPEDLVLEVCNNRLAYESVLDIS